MFHTRLRQGLVIHFWELVMHTFLSAVQQFIQDEDGITAIEYGLIAALMATAIAAGFLLIKDGLLSVLLVGICFGVLRNKTNTSTTAISHAMYDLILFALIMMGIGSL